MTNRKSWLKNAVIYNLLIDRFARGHNQPWLSTQDTQPIFCGGDLQGVIDKLDYLKSLGVTAILLTPFHPTTAYHGYHITDLYAVEPRFGDLETLRALITAAHSKNMYVIMDFVMGHVASEHPYFKDARANPDSQYKDWFTFYEWPDNYLSFLNYYELPKLNLKNPDVKEYIFKAARHWLSLGIDGLRLDHVIGVEKQFLRDFRDMIAIEFPHAVTFGEAVQGNFYWRDLKTLNLNYTIFLYLLSRLNIKTTFFIQLQYAKLLDGVLDFHLRDLIIDFLIRPRPSKPLWLLNAWLKFHRSLYPTTFSLISLLDNADDDRFSLFIRGDRERLKRILKFQFAQPQPALIYYGSEAGLTQTESRMHFEYGDKAHGDVFARALMPWNHIDQELLEFYQGVIKDRKNHK
jgi:glycosidase